MGSLDVDEFLTYLATERNVSPSTQKTALNAIVFLYRQFLNIPLDDLIFSYAKTSTRIPIVLSHDEALTIIDNIDSKYKLMVNIMYGCGLRLMECCRLRIQDIDFSMHQIIVRESKGNKQRTTVLPESLIELLKKQIFNTRKTHKYDLSRGYGKVYLPYALARKYKNAESDFKWQYLFAAPEVSKDPRDGTIRRHHIHESCLQKSVKRPLLSPVF